MAGTCASFGSKLSVSLMGIIFYFACNLRCSLDYQPRVRVGYAMLALVRLSLLALPPQPFAPFQLFPMRVGRGVRVQAPCVVLAPRLLRRQARA